MITPGILQAWAWLSISPNHSNISLVFYSASCCSWFPETWIRTWVGLLRLQRAGTFPGRLPLKGDGSGASGVSGSEGDVQCQSILSQVNGRAIRVMVMTLPLVDASLSPGGVTWRYIEAHFWSGLHDWWSKCLTFHYLQLLMTSCKVWLRTHPEPVCLWNISMKIMVEALISWDGILKRS